MERFNVEIPQTLADITVRQYQQYMSLIEQKDAKDEFINRRLLSIFYGIKSDMYEKLKVKDIEYLMIELSKVLEQKPKFQRVFEYGGEEFGFLPNLDNMTFGEFIDTDKYSTTKDMHKLMSVLFRKITKKKKLEYAVESYQGAHSRFLDAPVVYMLGAHAFFLTIASQLVGDILKSSIEEHPTQTKKILVENGLGTVALTRLRQGTFFDIQTLSNLMSTLA